MADVAPAAAAPPAETAAPAPTTLKWTQGTKDGECAITNAAGLRKALSDSGANEMTDNRFQITNALRHGRPGHGPGYKISADVFEEIW